MFRHSFESANVNHYIDRERINDYYGVYINPIYLILKNTLLQCKRYGIVYSRK